MIIFYDFVSFALISWTNLINKLSKLFINIKEVAADIIKIFF